MITPPAPIQLVDRSPGPKLARDVQVIERIEDRSQNRAAAHPPHLDAGGTGRLSVTKRPWCVAQPALAMSRKSPESGAKSRSRLTNLLSRQHRGLLPTTNGDRPRTAYLLHLDRRARLSELLLDRLGFFLRDAF